MKSEKPIPEPTEELKAQCDADNQFSNFERVFRSVMSVPKEEVLEQEAHDLRLKALKRAKGQKE